MRWQVRAEASEVETPRPATTTQGDQFLLSWHPAIQLREGVDHRVSVTEATATRPGIIHAPTGLVERTRQGRTSPIGTEGRTSVVLVVVGKSLIRLSGSPDMLESSAEDPEGERVDIVGGASRLRGQVDNHRRAPASYATGADGLGYDLIGEEEGGKVVGDSVAVGHQGSRARSAEGTTPSHTYNITSCGDLATTRDKWLQRFSSPKGNPYRVPC